MKVRDPLLSGRLFQEVSGHCVLPAEYPPPPADLQRVPWLSYLERVLPPFSFFMPTCMSPGLGAMPGTPVDPHLWGCCLSCLF